MNPLTKLTALDLARLFTLKLQLQGLISKAEIAQEDNELGSTSEDKMIDSYQRLENFSLVYLLSDRYHITQKGEAMLEDLHSHSRLLLHPMANES
jgi:hypothetical protein